LQHISAQKQRADENLSSFNPEAGRCIEVNAIVNRQEQKSDQRGDTHDPAQNIQKLQLVFVTVPRNSIGHQLRMLFQTRVSKISETAK
jgi:hypothetical protein